MCLAIPGKVIEVNTRSVPVMGKVSFGGVVKEVCLDWIPGVSVGEYVIVHVGFAISKVDEGEALRTLQLINEMTEGLGELNPEDG